MPSSYKIFNFSTYECFAPHKLMGVLPRGAKRPFCTSAKFCLFSTTTRNITRLRCVTRRKENKWAIRLCIQIVEEISNQQDMWHLILGWALCPILPYCVSVTQDMYSLSARVVLDSWINAATWFKLSAFSDGLFDSVTIRYEPRVQSYHVVTAIALELRDRVVGLGPAQQVMLSEGSDPANPPSKHSN